MPLHGVFRAAIQGMHDRGTGGFVYVKGEYCGYIFPRELQGQDEARDAMQDLLTDEASMDNIFVLENRDDKLHVLAYSKEVVKKALGEALAEGAVAAETAVEEAAEEDGDGERLVEEVEVEQGEGAEQSEQEDDSRIVEEVEGAEDAP